METVTLKVTGMTCTGCVRSVKRVLEKVQGVVSVEVSLERAEAVVGFDPMKASRTELTTAVHAAGYEAA